MKHSIPSALFVKSPAAYDNTDPAQISVSTSRQETEAGPVRNVRYNGLTGVVVAHRKLLDSTALGGAVRSLEAQLGISVEKISEANSNGAQGNYLAVEVERHTAPIVAAWNNYNQVTRRTRENFAVRKARVMAVPEGNESLRATLAAWYFSHSPVERIKLAIGAEFDLAASIMQLGQKVSGLDDRVWTEFTDHWLGIRHIQMSGMQADYALRPSTDFITAAGPDTKAAYDAARKLVGEFKAEMELLDLAEQFAQSVLNVLMMITQKTASEFL